MVLSDLFVQHLVLLEDLFFRGVLIGQLLHFLFNKLCGKPLLVLQLLHAARAIVDRNRFLK